MRTLCTILAIVILAASLVIGYVLAPVLNTFGGMFDWWNNTVSTYAIIGGCGLIGLISGGTVFMVGYLYARVKKLERKLRKRAERAE